MRKLTGLKFGVAPIALGIAMLATPAFAQDEQGGDEAAETEHNAIIVTGTRVSNPNLELSSPVAVVGSEELNLRQTNTAEQFLRELPSAVPSIGSAVNNGNGGASFVNLRGLGSQRNLVLLDGRRFVPADETGRVDLNNIPLAVIEQTEILTGGATTTYGADAVSGVVNFITKRDFAGIEFNTSYQTTEEGDGEIFRTDLTLGANFDDGRGNAVLSIGYQDQNEVLQGDRGFSDFFIGSYDGAPSGSSNAVPAFIIGPGGPGAPVSGQINEAGTDVGAFDRPFNFNPFNLFQTPFERFNIFGSARYEISDSAEVYTQAAFSKQTVGTIIAPGGSFFNTYSFNLNNPLIPDAIAQRFADRIGLTAAQFAAARGTQFGAFLPDGSANPDYVEFSAQVRRRTVEAGVRTSDFQTTLFNLVAGVRGDITDNIQYDVSATYGESERVQRSTGFARFSRLQQSLLAIPDGNGGVVCTDTSGNCLPINLFGPLGSLGSPEAIAGVFNQTQFVNDNSTIGTINGLITGDLETGILAKPVSWALGAEYRRFTAGQFSDDASQIPGEVVGGGGADPNFSGDYDVVDFFGEVAVPVIEGKPGFESLTFEAGIRYSDYELAGTETTWKLGGSWEPIPDVTIRGNYQRAARAPNIGELFFPTNVGLDNLSVDPCAGAAPLNNAALAAVCVAQGAPQSTIGNILQPAAGQINVTFGGNPNLGVEKADTWTLGVVAQPAFVPGLTVSLDYFNIEIEDAISSPNIGDIISGCFNTNNLDYNNNPACQLIQRSAFTGGLDGSPDEVPGLLLSLSNSGRIETDGLDLSVNYSTELSENVGLRLAFNGTWTNKNTFNADASNPVSVNRDCVGYYSVNCGSIQPEFVFDQRSTFNFGDNFSLSLRWRYLSSTEYEPLAHAADILNAEAANRDSAGVLLPVALQDCPDYLDTDPGACLVEEGFRNISAENYFDLTGQLDVTENLLLTVTIQNLFDNQPHVVGGDVGSTAYNSGNTFPSTYDALGRRYGASLKLTF